MHPFLTSQLVDEHRAALTRDALPLRVRTLEPHHRGAIESGAPLGLARCVRDARDPTRADVAATVLDRWQGRGVGTALMAELARRAAAEGVTTFDATIFADNRAARRLAAGLGDASSASSGSGVTSLEVRIA
jgi:GNAT superfamily N-acetyltransferase